MKGWTLNTARLGELALSLGCGTTLDTFATSDHFLALCDVVQVVRVDILTRVLLGLGSRATFHWVDISGKALLGLGDSRDDAGVELASMVLLGRCLLGRY